MSLPTVLVLGALLLTGCATESGSEGGASAGTNRPAEVASAEPAEPVAVEEPAEEPVEEPVDTGPLAFGETFTYTDGVSITVGAPVAFDPDEYSRVEGATDYLRFPITIVNGSSANLDPAAWYGTLQSANVEAEKIYDGQLGEEPTTTLLPGREAAFSVGYAVQDPADLVFEVTAGMFDYDNAIYTNAG